MSRRSRGIPEINAGSMADIAFLLLVFFLVTTTMDTDKGLRVKLPPYPDFTNPPPKTEQYERNVLEVLVNSNDQLLVENQLMSIEGLTKLTKDHLTNEGRNPKLAESSLKAIVSLKNDRGTSYERYLEVYNELMRAYNEVRNEYALAKYGRPYNDLPGNGESAKDVKTKYPMKISEAEPVSYGEGG
ncbi:MAG: biopolymer transporter ExbD [Flavobacteriales bacterium]|nr:biopolymer transporter ExbD [Bacteroidota bacterium]MCB9240776.1 biopolymer transporter ExbD [Flavobacteriales bacterium]